MTTPAPKAEIVPAEEVSAILNRPVAKINNVRTLLAIGGDSIAKVLPKHLTPDRLAKVLMLAINKTPDLLGCTGASLLQAIIQSASLGLEPGGALGHAYLIPYGNACTFIIGYRGMLDLARRSGQIESIEAHVVYANDRFVVRFGTDSCIEHEPCLDKDPGEFRAVYSVAKLKDGGLVTEVMTKREVEAIRTRSRAGNNGPWKTDYNEMARKTVVRRIFKYLPVSVELAEAIETQDAHETVDGSLTLDAIGAAARLGNDEPSTGDQNERLALVQRLAKTRVERPAVIAAALTACGHAPDSKFEPLNLDQLTLVAEAVDAELKKGSAK